MLLHIKANAVEEPKQESSNAVLWGHRRLFVTLIWAYTYRSHPRGIYTECLLMPSNEVKPTYT